MSIDLHVHTNFSDGTDSPEDIIKKAEIIGLNTIAITDHETIDGLSKVKESKVNVISGVEISAKWEKIKVNNNESGIHVLFYFVKPKTDLHDLLKKIRDEKKLRNLEIINKLKNLDIELDIEEIQKNENQVLGRPHIAKLMVDGGYVDSITEAFNRFLGNGKPAYTDLHQISISKLLEVAKDSKVISILAHPHTLDPKKNMLINRQWINKDLASNLSELKRMGLDGVETYYSSYDDPTRKQLSKLAMETGLLETGGSDYHGDMKPGLSLGTGWENKPLNVPDEIGFKLREKYESIK
ncbi:MAG: PHP domain-containing protein [Actinomycetota bacterium]|nr:PHP domain-containing protein [Actinomycetota bacterium]|tara:strand:+ start:707 stop:1594 length:888 start_codon:yes stop_codon:yes gene_type:complete